MAGALDVVAVIAQITPARRIPVWAAQLPIVAASLGCLAYAARDLSAALRAPARR